MRKKDETHSPMHKPNVYLEPALSPPTISYAKSRSMNNEFFA
jgi:hypothetical protein